MKRVFLALLCFLGVMQLNAQDETIDYKFSLDKDGECEIVDTIVYDVSTPDCYKLIKDWLYKTANLSLSFTKQKKNEYLSFNNMFYVEKHYNSFSGAYSNNFMFDCDIRFEGNKLIYKLHNMYLVKSYSGYGITEKKLPVAERIHKIENAKVEIKRLQDDKNLSKTERRDAIEEQNEILADAEILAKCHDHLFKRLTDLIGMIKWK